jgi:hypothetical protein
MFRAARFHDSLAQTLTGYVFLPGMQSCTIKILTTSSRATEGSVAISIVQSFLQQEIATSAYGGFAMTISGAYGVKNYTFGSASLWF